MDSGQPTNPVSRRWLAAFALAWFGYWTLLSVPGQFLTADLVARLAPDRKVDVLTVVQVVVSVVWLVWQPVAGWGCDRTRARIGHRRPWILGGFIVAGLGFMATGSAPGPASAVVAFTVTALGLASASNALWAVMADTVPATQRGVAAATRDVPMVAALVLGIVLTTTVLRAPAQQWLVLGAVGVLATLPFLLFGYPTKLAAAGAAVATSGGFSVGPAPHNPSSPAPGFTGAPDPPPPIAPVPRGHRHGDLVRATAARLTVFVAGAAGTSYLLYYLGDVLHRADPLASLLTLLVVTLAATAVGGVVAGPLCDTWGRRKPVLVAATLSMASAAWLLAALPDWRVAHVAAALLGLGNGAFGPPMEAMLTDALPDPTRRARDLSLVNAAMALPLAPVLAWTVLTYGGSYRTLFAVTGLVGLLGGLGTLTVRGSR